MLAANPFRSMINRVMTVPKDRQRPLTSKFTYSSFCLQPSAQSFAWGGVDEMLVDED